MQIHNYGLEFDDEEPNLEFLAPCHIYVVSNGTVTNIDLNAIPVRPCLALFHVSMLEHASAHTQLHCSSPRT